jgi:Ca-activated chloride channel homolog
MPEQFHFLAPWWLLALIPLLLLAWRAYRPGGGDNPWRRVVDAALLPLLMRDHARTAVRAAPWLLGLAWTVAVLALANPTWERLPQRVYQTSAARVVVLDLSQTMEATDLPPSRLARARYRIEDILALSTEGQTGLVAYAGDAFTVAPLTRDANTIAALLRALDPGIMPVEGSRADLGLLKAAELLRQAGASDGQVLLIADGIDADQTTAAQRAAASLRRQGYRVSVIGVVAFGNAPAATSSKPGPSVAALDTAALQAVAREGGGEYQPIAASGDALKHLLDDPALLHAETATSDTAAQAWQARGPWIVLLLLPLAALSFRRNWLLGVMLLAAMASPPENALASTWDDLWRRPDQQSAKALAAGDFAGAARLAEDPARRGSAEYRLGEYDKAAQSFAHGQGADADYNRGNALAKLGRYDEAIAAYDKALEADSTHEDARANKAAVERMRQQQQAQAPTQADNTKPDADKRPENKSSSGEEERPNPGSSSQEADAKHAENAGKSNGTSEQPNDATAKNDAASKSSGSDDAKSENRAAPKDSARNQFAEAADRLAKERENQKPQENSPDGQAKARDDARSSPGSPRETAAGRPGVDAQARDRAPAAASSDALQSEEQMAAEQWLRRIPDDPGGLLRRKFLYQYRQRAQRDGGER